MKKLILPSALTIVLSCLVTYYLYSWIIGFQIHPEIKNDFSDNMKITMIVKLLFTWLIYFFGLITLPFLQNRIIKKCSLEENHWLIIVLGLELLFILFSYSMTPPDLSSTVFLFILSQPIVVVNAVVLKLKLKVS